MQVGDVVEPVEGAAVDVGSFRVSAASTPSEQIEVEAAHEKRESVSTDKCENSHEYVKSFWLKHPSDNSNEGL
ncbi:hypothetical protein ABLN64_05790, partial [Mycobacterium tuberculosis]